MKWLKPLIVLKSLIIWFKGSSLSVILKNISMDSRAVDSLSKAWRF